MADYRIIKKSDDKFHPETRKKLFWHNLKGENGGKSKVLFNSFVEARDYVFAIIKKSTV